MAFGHVGLAEGTRLGCDELVAAVGAYVDVRVAGFGTVLVVAGRRVRDGHLEVALGIGVGVLGVGERLVGRTDLHLDARSNLGVLRPAAVDRRAVDALEGLHPRFVVTDRLAGGEPIERRLGGRPAGVDQPEVFERFGPFCLLSQDAAVDDGRVVFGGLACGLDAVVLGEQVVEPGGPLRKRRDAVRLGVLPEVDGHRAGLLCAPVVLIQPDAHALVAALGMGTVESLTLLVHHLDADVPAAHVVAGFERRRGVVLLRTGVAERVVDHHVSDALAVGLVLVEDLDRAFFLPGEQEVGGLGGVLLEGIRDRNPLAAGRDIVAVVPPREHAVLAVHVLKVVRVLIGPIIVETRIVPGAIRADLRRLLGEPIEALGPLLHFARLGRALGRRERRPCHDERPGNDEEDREDDEYLIGFDRRDVRTDVVEFDELIHPADDVCVSGGDGDDEVYLEALLSQGEQQHEPTEDRDEQVIGPRARPRDDPVQHEYESEHRGVESEAVIPIEQRERVARCLGFADGRDSISRPEAGDALELTDKEPERIGRDDGEDSDADEPRAHDTDRVSRPRKPPLLPQTGDRGHERGADGDGHREEGVSDRVVGRL